MTSTTQRRHLVALAVPAGLGQAVAVGPDGFGHSADWLATASTPTPGTPLRKVTFTTGPQELEAAQWVGRPSCPVCFVKKADNGSCWC